MLCKYNFTDADSFNEAAFPLSLTLGPSSLWVSEMDVDVKTGVEVYRVDVEGQVEESGLVCGMPWKASIYS